MIEEIKQSIQCLKSDGIIFSPTDSIWGLSCDAKSDSAIQRIIELKKRPEHKSFIILLPSENLLAKYVRSIPEMSYDLIEFTTKPLTIIFPDAYNISPLIPSSDGSVGIRIVKSGFMHELLSKYNRALVSTSANYSGEEAPKTPDEADKSLLAKIDYVVNLPTQSKTNMKPSSIVKLEMNGSIKIIRE
ncbi:MAG TPA: L-threonylcarbamoyladenylate synthase [Bacteroidia bacterium]|nr:L-threonylcarbamoyladenylate synthase [Bacteroidia bacterium]HNT79150.1 L-threonylcarbamoyladenylate synthase [Bacteroidia bacterium]